MNEQTKKINELIDLHSIIDRFEGLSFLRKDRCQYSKWLIEQELLEEGHSLKGIKNCSRNQRG